MSFWENLKLRVSLVFFVLGIITLGIVFAAVIGQIIVWEEKNGKVGMTCFGSMIILLVISFVYRWWKE